MIKKRNSRPTANEHGLLKAYLAGKEFNALWIKNNVGLTRGNRLLRKINNQLRAGLKRLPRT